GRRAGMTSQRAARVRRELAKPLGIGPAVLLHPDPVVEQDLLDHRVPQTFDGADVVVQRHRRDLERRRHRTPRDRVDPVTPRDAHAGLRDRTATRLPGAWHTPLLARRSPSEYTLYS